MALHPAARGFTVHPCGRLGAVPVTYTGNILETKGERYGEKQSVRYGVF